MKWTMAAALIASHALLGASSVSAQDLFRPLTPAQQRAFEAFAFAAWVEDYCESTYWASHRLPAGFGPVSGQTGVGDFQWNRIICTVTKTTAGVPFSGRIVERSSTLWSRDTVIKVALAQP
jgi:hypothetical protein